MNKEAVYKRNIIIACVLTFLLITGMIAGYAFGPYKNLQRDITLKQTEARDAKVEADKLASANQALVDAQQQEVTLGTQLEFLRGRYRSLYIDNGDGPADTNASQNVKNGKLYLTFRRWQNEYFALYGLALRQELNDAVVNSGVRLAGGAGNAGAPAGPPASAPGSGGAGGTEPRQELDVTVSNATLPKNPEDCIPLTAAATNGLLQPVAPISFTVTGDLGSILRFFDILTSERSTILKTVSSTKLDGTSPDITATCTVTPYLVLTGPSVKITAAGGGAPAGGAPAGGPPGAGGPPSSRPPGAGGPPTP